MTLQEMRQKYAALCDAQKAIIDAAVTAGRPMTDAEKTDFNAKQPEIDTWAETIRAAEAAEARDKQLSQPVGKLWRPAAQPKDHEPLRLFKNLGEQLHAIKRAEVDHIVDERLIQIKNAALGMNEGIDSEGGFVIQTDIAGTMMESAAKAGQILSRVDKYQISSNADSVKWMEIEETDISSTVFGGVQVFWIEEAGTTDPKKPKMQEREFKLLKLMGLAYATYELEQDSNFVSQLYQKAFELAIQRELEACIVGGTGGGKPLGFLKGGNLVTVSKETGQAADTILYPNIVKMYNRAINKEDAGWIWLLHPDVHEELDFLQFPVGTGGVPVYLQASQAGTLDSLKGKPIVESDQCSAIGDLGDINFVNLGEYFLIYKGGVDAASSIHVQFLTAQNCYRFIFRANGMPKKRAKLTIKNSSKDRSSFITLQAR